MSFPRREAMWEWGVTMEEVNEVKRLDGALGEGRRLEIVKIE